MKTYVLTVSRVFPKTHARSGEPTNFREKILSGLDRDSELVATCFQKPPKKLHTIRANYYLWKKRIDEVNAGEAILSVRYWSGKPYNSKQLRIAEFDKDSGIGVQELKFEYNRSEDHDHDGYDLNQPFICPQSGDELYRDISISELSTNDGLSYEDFLEWFRKYDLSKPMAIIHFTKFRY